MAQLIQHKRGALERLSNITGSLKKGEILIVTGSSNITSSNGSSIVFAATESGSVQATNRFIIGSSAPNQFPTSTYGGLVNGVPYYDSGSGTLYLLGSDGNTAINLTGNINVFSASVATSFSASNASIASITGDFSSSVATSFSASNANLNTLSSSISQSIVDIVSASLSSSLSVIATDIEVAIVSASLSSSQALISSSISTSLHNALDNIETYFPAGVISSSQQVIDIFNANFTAGSTMASTVDTTFATDNELFVTSSNLDAGEF
jgi:epidermal growth factor receptor substrate 15